MSIKGYITEWLPGRVQDTVQTFIVQADGTSQVIPGDLYSDMLTAAVQESGKHLERIQRIGERGLAWQKRALELERDMAKLHSENLESLATHRKAAADMLFDAVQFILKAYYITSEDQYIADTRRMVTKYLDSRRKA